MEIEMTILHWKLNVPAVFGIILIKEGKCVLSVSSYVLVTCMRVPIIFEYDLSTAPTISILANTQKPHSIP
jgi:hypothetical protein